MTNAASIESSTVPAKIAPLISLTTPIAKNAKPANNMMMRNNAKDEEIILFFLF